MAPRDLGQDAGPFWKRLAWMAGLWTASVLVLGVVAMAIRAVLHA